MSQVGLDLTVLLPQFPSITGPQLSTPGSFSNPALFLETLLSPHPPNPFVSYTPTSLTSCFFSFKPSPIEDSDVPQIFKGTIISFFLFSLGANKNIVYLCGLKLSWPCAGKVGGDVCSP